MEENDYQQSEMAELDLASLDEESLPEGHKSGFVAVVGRPNVGKSTLLNALLRQKIAIVSPRPQTTRNNQLGILTEKNFQIIFIDTPGIIKPRHKLDEFMVASADQSIQDADVILWLLDVSDPPGPGDQAIADLLKQLPDDIDIILAMNKSDLVMPNEVIERTNRYHDLLPNAHWLLISAMNNDGTDQLLNVIVEALPHGPRYYPMDQTTDLFMRDLAAELIREEIFVQMREELPYGTTVMIDEFKERDNGITYIKATIYIESESHKKIIIGSRGRQLRKIGSNARKKIESLIEGKVYLDLWVKVAPHWRRDENALKRFGYASS